jgi:hypothetical protein
VRRVLTAAIARGATMIVGDGRPDVAAVAENARAANSGERREWLEESSRLTPPYAERFYQMD